MESRQTPKLPFSVRAGADLHMKNKNIIGVIGGMGPYASAEFYRLPIEGARHLYGAKQNDEYPEILIDSVPVPDFLSNTEKMEEAAQMLECRVRRLTDYGSTIITMVSNTACVLTNRLQRQTDAPFISVVDEVIRVASKNSRPVLLLASPTSLRLGLYQLALARHNIAVGFPNQL